MKPYHPKFWKLVVGQGNTDLANQIGKVIPPKSQLSSSVYWAKVLETFL